jgi:predicted transcriptional regulator
MVKRSSDEIFASILKAAASREGTNLTRLMYDSLLSHRALSHYLKILIKFELIVNIHEKKMYRTTEKGRRYLKLAENIDNLLGPVIDPSV